MDFCGVAWTAVTNSSTGFWWMLIHWSMPPSETYIASSTPSVESMAYCHVCDCAAYLGVD
jgi:hypothetical protein